MEVNGYQYLINTVHLSAERRHSTSPPSFPPSGTTDLHSTPTWNGRPHLTGLIFRGRLGLDSLVQFRWGLVDEYSSGESGDNGKRLDFGLHLLCQRFICSAWNWYWRVFAITG